jgi:uncharacterized cupin superfamily protein
MREVVVVPEAQLARIEAGLLPEGEGWFVLNAREATWWRSDDFGAACGLDGKARFAQLGVNIRVLMPGEPNGMYHAENAQEDFLVLSGECLLIIEGQERPLRQWDFVHSPPWTEHIFVGAGSGPCAILMVGARPTDETFRYPVEDVALKHGAGVEQETPLPDEAYARFAEPQRTAYHAGDLP